MWASEELDAKAALKVWRFAAPRSAKAGGAAVVHEQLRGAQFAKLAPDFVAERTRAEKLTGEAFFKSREQAYRDQEAKINASLARVKAGKPETSLDQVYVKMCKSSPQACVELHRVDELAKQRDRLTEVPEAGPLTVPFFASPTADKLDRGQSYRVYLAATEPWALPVLFQFGGWNDCPLPHEQAAALRHWAKHYGATPILLGGDTLELQVARPPATLEAVKQVSWQHYLLTEDAIEQGAGDMKTLSIGTVAPQWFFWWD